MALFHLDYPESKTFYKWDEMGCLCRALGFPSGLFKTQMEAVKDEIRGEENGVSMKTLQRVWELKVMFKCLHRTFNMHTADWNTCTFTNALYLLSHRALSFQDLHNIRVAYCAYEHIDMKGMMLDKHTLLRTLKMCGRTIAPLKLMHRIKHMKGTFDEKGRIQLYEFFNLILWCDMYTSYSPEDMETSSGKEEELFRLVDFHRLLSHHDERMSQALNATYLKEEWDFGMECLGPKELFKEPVVNTDARVAQANYHQTKYRHLKQEVGISQKRVYRAHAGTIRSRPVSAPDLDEYRHVGSALTRGSTTATQMYESVQRRLHSAPSRGLESSMSKLERPSLPEHRRVQTPQVITPRDLTDVRLKMDNLSFDMSTLGVRCELQVEKEMDFYIPGYMEKLANRRPDPIPVPEPEKKPLHWTSKIVNNLAYPKAAPKSSHNKSCDARHRGWQKVAKRPGTHVILTSQAHPNTEHGKLFSKMEQSAMEPVQYLHPEYVVRYTPKSALPAAPSSATPTSSTTTTTGKSKKQSAANVPNFDFKSLKNNNNDEDVEMETETKNQVQTTENKKGRTKPKVDMEFFHSKYLSGDSSLSQPSETKQAHSKVSYPSGISSKAEENNIENERKVLQPQIKTRNCPDVVSEPVVIPNPEVTHQEDVPVPYMEHSRPKIVGVGQIGTISLLESIQESRDLEEQFVEEVMKKGGRGVKDDDGDGDDIIDNDGCGEDENNDDDIDDAEELSKTLKLDLQRDIKSQQSRKLKSSQVKDSVPPKRKTRSAPTLKKSPRKVSTSPQKMRRGLKSSGSTRCKSADEKQGVARQISNASGSMADDAGSATTLTSSYAYGTTLSSSEDATLHKFRSARGSVTSEENENVNDDAGGCDDSRGTVTTRRMLTGSCRLEGDEIDSRANNHDEDEVESIYSDAMTLPSSSGLTELESSPSPSRRLRGVPDICLDLERSLDSNGKKMDKRMTTGQRVVQFNTLGQSGLLSPMNSRPGVVTSLSDGRRDSFKIMTDYRDYLSDSGVKVSDSDGASQKRTFSKATRDRLISRVENSISPDLRTMLLTDANNKISIPAS